MSIPMIVKKPFRPTGSGSRLLKVGEPFEAASKAQARLLRALGRADDAPVAQPAPPAPPAPAAPAPRTYRTRSIEVPEPVFEPIAQDPVIDQAAAPDESADDAPNAKRTYRRRDLTAES